MAAGHRAEQHDQTLAQSPRLPVSHTTPRRTQTTVTELSSGQEPSDGGSANSQNSGVWNLAHPTALAAGRVPTVPKWGQRAPQRAVCISHGNQSTLTRAFFSLKPTAEEAQRLNERLRGKTPPHSERKGSSKRSSNCIAGTDGRVLRVRSTQRSPASRGFVAS